MTVPFSIGAGGTVPANTTGNSMSVGNASSITAGMYDCTALKGVKMQVGIGLGCVYGFGIILVSVVMTIVRGKNIVES